jgi:hypothetical protein
VTYNFKKISDLVTFDWDNAYQRVFGQEFGMDYFEGPRDVELEYIVNKFDQHREVKPPVISKNTFLMDYKDAPEILSYVLKTEEERLMMILQYDIYRRFTTADQRKTL